MRLDNISIRRSGQMRHAGTAVETAGCENEGGISRMILVWKKKNLDSRISDDTGSRINSSISRRAIE